MLFAFLMGVAYGVGGTAFDISIRYVGFALTYSIAVGLSILSRLWCAAKPALSSSGPARPGCSRELPPAPSVSPSAASPAASKSAISDPPKANTVQLTHLNDPTAPS
jgi:hypothetical protein